MENEITNKRMRIKTNKRRWTKEDTVVFLHKILEHKSKFEKPSAQIFYKKLKGEELSLAEYSWIGMRDRVRNLKTKYREAVAWRDTTGAGLLEENEETTVEEMDDIFGEKANVVPPLLYESVNPASLLEIEEVMDVTAEHTHTEEEGSFHSQEENEDMLATPSVHPVGSYKEQFSKGSRKINAPLDHLAQMHESKSKFLADRLKLDEHANEQKCQFKKEELEIEKEKLILEREKVRKGLHIEEERLNLEREKVHAGIRLEEKKLQEEIRLKELEIERNYQLKKLEIELKYKANG